MQGKGGYPGRGALFEPIHQLVDHRREAAQLLQIPTTVVGGDERLEVDRRQQGAQQPGLAAGCPELRPPDPDRRAHERGCCDSLPQDPVGGRVRGRVGGAGSEPEAGLPGGLYSLGREIVPLLDPTQFAPGQVGEMTVVEQELPVLVGQFPRSRGH